MEETGDIFNYSVLEIPIFKTIPKVLPELKRLHHPTVLTKPKKKKKKKVE